MDEPQGTRTEPSKRSKPRQAYLIEPGHEAWVVGDERFIGYEFDSRAAEEYATRGKAGSCCNGQECLCGSPTRCPPRTK
jgi:hypothetical protein